MTQYNQNNISTKTPTFLLTNDDGYNSPGLAAICGELKKLGRVTVVAPEGEMSGVSHSLTLMRPLRIKKIPPFMPDIELYTVDGSPADCVKLGLDKILLQPPDMLIAGINRGANTGVSILYSGTVAAAAEGTLAGIPSIAISRSSLEKDDFTFAATIGARIIKHVLLKGLPEHVFLNVNIPLGNFNGDDPFKITHQGNRRYIDAALEHHDPRDEPYYWLKMKRIESVEDQDADDIVLKKGFVSITPLKVDRTDYSFIDSLREWKW